MTNQLDTSKNRLALGVEKLTQNMQKDFDDAKKLHNDNKAKIQQTSRLEKLRKFIGHVAQIDVNEIQMEDNVRQQMDLESDEFASLKESIKKDGVQQNLIIEFIEANDEKGYKLKCVAGHRRLTAAKMVGLTAVPCLIKKFKNDADKVEIALAENLLREDLHCLDIADGYQQLLDKGWNKQDLTSAFDRKGQTISRYLKMAQWPKEAKEIIRANPAKFSARTLLNNFASKKYTSNNTLLSELSAIARVSPDTSRARKNKNSNQLKDRLDNLLEEKKIEATVRIVVRDIFRELGLFA